MRGNILRRAPRWQLSRSAKVLASKLVGDLLRNFALDGKDIGQIAVIGLGPEMRISPSINQLRSHAHFAICSLDASFENVRNAELLARSHASSVSRRQLVLHHARAADHLQVRDLGQSRQNIVLHAVGKKRVLFAFAEIFEGKNSDAFLRNRKLLTE